jgi:DedD protein
MAPIPAAGDPPNVQPVPEAVVDRVEVQIERGGVPTRTQVAADGRTLEEVPIEGGAPIVPSPAARPAPARPAGGLKPAAPQASRKQFIVQVGAFSVEANARSLQERLAAIGQSAHIVRDDLYRVRLGPFPTRDQAVAARSALEANGLSAIIVNE